MAGRVENLRPWQPGQSGNPGGRPKKKPITEELERPLDTDPSLFEGSFKSNLHERVFQPRNQILHFGRTADYGHDEALQAVKATAAAIRVYDNMDRERAVLLISDLTHRRG